MYGGDYGAASSSSTAHTSPPGMMPVGVSQAHMHTPPPGFAYPRGAGASAAFMLPPISAALGVDALPPLSRGAGAAAASAADSADLASISRGPIDVPDGDMQFVMSPELVAALRAARTRDLTPALQQRVIAEATRYADTRKSAVRNALKERQHNAAVHLSPIDKSKLRSRREAKVHRVKERAFERALKDAIHWFIDDRATDNPAGTAVAMQTVPHAPQVRQDSHHQQHYGATTQPLTLSRPADHRVAAAPPSLNRGYAQPLSQLGVHGIFAYHAQLH